MRTPVHVGSPAALAALTVLMLMAVSLSGCIGGTSDTPEPETTTVAPPAEGFSEYEGDLAGVCLESHGGLGQHIHPHLTLTIEGTTYGVPEDLGIETDTCPNGMHVVHTHDNTSNLHVETNEPVYVRVEILFRIWGMPFDSNRIDRYVTNDTHELIMQVDGVNSQDWEQHIFSDGELIEIIYRERS